MRKLLAVLTLALVTGACAGDTAGPADDANTALLNELAALGYSSMLVGDPGSGDHLMGRLARLPADLALSDAQVARIRELIDAFVAATAADRDALAAIHGQAAEARRNGGSPDDVRAILAAGAEVRARLHQAEQSLHQAIMGVLTPAQRAALTNRTPPAPPCALTEAQRTEISGLRAAYEQANAADIARVRSIHERARAAQLAGAPREQIAAILAEARDPVQRLRAAQAALHEAIRAVLSPEQRASCFR